MDKDKTDFARQSTGLTNDEKRKLSELFNDSDFSLSGIKAAVDRLLKWRDAGKGPTNRSMLEDVEYTEAGVAERLARDLKGQIRFVPKARRWHVWNRSYWKVDQQNVAPDLVMEQIHRYIAAELATGAIWADRVNAYGFDVERWKVDPRFATPPNIKPELYPPYKMMLAYTGRNKFRNVVGFIQEEAIITMAPGDFDSDLDLMGTPGATVNLRTGEAYAPRSGDYISRQCAVTYNPKAKGERFQQFIDEITNHDAELAAYLQSVLGYALTGHYREQSLFWLYGPSAANGKDTLLNIVRGVISDYGVWAASGMLTQRRFQPHHAEVADMNGARVVMHKELDQGQKLDAGRVKEFTGSAVIKTHFMAENWFDMPNTHTHIFAVNHLPPISGDDHGMMRRMVVIPFNVKFWAPDDPAKPKDGLLQDPTVENTILENEAEAVMAWLVEGARRWYRDGALHQPPAVRTATLRYLEQASDVWVWVEEVTVPDPDAFSSSEALHASYSNWCESNGRKAMDAAVFGKKMSALGYESGRKQVGGKPTRGFAGLRFRMNTVTLEDLLAMKIEVPK